MRSNGGKDESRNNLQDTTMRDRDLGRGDTAIVAREPKARGDHRIGRKDKRIRSSPQRDRGRASPRAFRCAWASRAPFGVAPLARADDAGKFQTGGGDRSGALHRSACH
jgi:hypothetical protein